MPSRNASLAPGAGHHLIGDIPVAMHMLSMVQPAARSLPAVLITARAGVRGEDIPNHCRQLSIPC